MAIEKIHLVILKELTINNWFGEEDIAHQKMMVKYATTDKDKAEKFRNDMDLSDVVYDNGKQTIKKYAKVVSLPQDTEIGDFIYGLV